MSNDKLLECQSRAYLGGLSTGSIVFAGLYFVQRFATKNLPFILGTSVVFAGASTYLVVKEKLKECDRSCNISRTDALAKFKDQ